MFSLRRLQFALAVALLSASFYSCSSNDTPDTPTTHPSDTLATQDEVVALPEVLTVSDIHFSPYHDKAVFAKLLTSPYSEWEAIFETTTDTAFSTYNFDSNYALFKASLEKMKLESPNPDYIMISGDFLAHGFEDSFAIWSGIAYAEQQASDFGQLDGFITKTINFMAGMWSKYYPNTPIYAALGNNDAFCGDYLVQPGGNFLKVFADAFGPLTHNKAGVNTFYETFEKGGYFAQEAAHDPNLRIIVLNTILFSPNFNNPWKSETYYCKLGHYGENQAGPGDTMLLWLDQQLTDAAAAGQKVWMMQHIPTGLNVDHCIPKEGESGCLGPKAGLFMTEHFNTKYLAMIQKHAAIIKLNIAGHYHRDDFRLYEDASGNNAVSWLHVLPAISPIYDNNPGFQVATYDKTTSILEDYTCYFVDVQQPVYSEAAWPIEYKFSDIYGVTGMTTANMEAIHNKLVSDTELQKKYLTYYPVSEMTSVQQDIPHIMYFICGQNAYTLEEYTACVCESEAN